MRNLQEYTRSGKIPVERILIEYLYKFSQELAKILNNILNDLQKNFKIL